MNSKWKPMDPPFRQRLQGIRLVSLDVDGVLTDGGLYYQGDDELIVRFHVQDGLGIKLLREAGIEVAVISARSSTALRRRVEELGIRHFRTDTHDKLDALRQIAQSLGIGLEQACHVGDDLVDVPVMREVGFAASVADAHPAARQVAHWVASRRGGCGAVRQIADLLVEARSGAGPEFGVIIPARFGSSRLPGKPLLDVAGKPMVLRVVDSARQAGASFVIVATDDERIQEAVTNAGVTAVMTSKDHASGTDRLAEVARCRGFSPESIVVNVQGDEPLLPSDWVRAVAEALAARPAVGMATAATAIREPAELMNPNVVKVTTDRDRLAVAFSRAPIPWVRGHFQPGQPIDVLPSGVEFLRHIGLYAYRVSALIEVAGQAPVRWEQAESLEQLRAQWLGIRIHVTVVDEAPGPGVDTEADLAAVRAVFEARGRAKEGSRQ